MIEKHKYWQLSLNILSYIGKIHLENTFIIKNRIDYKIRIQKYIYKDTYTKKLWYRQKHKKANIKNDKSKNNV